MPDSRIAIQARELTKWLGGRVVLDKVDLDVVAGETVALTGANGAGKTTLLRCLASVLRPHSGEVRWFGRAANADPRARRLIGMVAHESSLYSKLTVRENLIFAARMCGVRDPARRADRLLESIGLRPYAHRPPTRISRGMRQRLAVMRAVVHEPRILLLDEPFSGLDRNGAEWLLNLLKGFHEEGRTICFVTHDKPQTEHLADRVLELHRGRLREIEQAGAALREAIPIAARAA